MATVRRVAPALAWCALIVLVLAVIGGTAVSVLHGRLAYDRPDYTGSDLDAATSRVCREAARLIDNEQPAEARVLIVAARKEQASGAPPRCPQQYEDSLLADAELARGATANPWWASDLSYAWERFSTEVLTPQAARGTAAIGILVSLLVVSRLLTGPISSILTVKKRRPVRSFVRGAFAVAGVLVMVLSAAIVAIALTLQWPSNGIVAVAFLLIGVGGAALYCWWLSSRLRLVIDVTGKDVDPSVAVRLASAIAEIGGALPRGAEIPVGSDVNVLRSDFIAVKSANPWLGSLQIVIGWFLAVAPWRVTVGKSADTDGAFGLVITRNTRAIAAFVISTSAVIPHASASDWDKAEEQLKPELLTFCASAVVVTLSRYYQGFEELCGVRDWKSLGLQVVATARALPREGQVYLLAWAMRVDPGNFLALVALQRLRYDREVSLDDRLRYQSWLTAALGFVRKSSAGTAVEVKAGYYEAHARILFAYCANALNIRGTSLRPVTEGLPGEVDNLDACIGGLSRRSPVLYEQMLSSGRFIALALRLSADNWAAEEDVLEAERLLSSASPFSAFNAANYFALLLRCPGNRNQTDRAFFNLVRAIGVASLDPLYKKRINDDPVLGEQANQPWFTEVATRLD